ncbi:MAG: hypothetical protein O8C66_06690 [Candidatus Methanoperedens sp.]|nr:hypothetical protein [Candidatus Methanoperedens sp.]MCZ7370179.1 hypothetical protein [Candidatus Methanoperedens sp.]
MKQIQALRYGGLVGVIGAAVYIISLIIHPFYETPETIVSQAWLWAHILGFVSLLFLLVGLVAIYFKNVEAFGKLGTLGFALSFMGIGGLSWINGFAAMAEPVLISQAPNLLDPNGPFFGGLAGIFFAITVIISIVGFLLFGIAAWRIKEKFSGIAIIIGTLPLVLFFIRPETPEGIYSIALIINSLGLLRLSYGVWSAKN